MMKRSTCRVRFPSYSHAGLSGAAALLLLGGALFGLPAARGQSGGYYFSRVVNENQARPDGQGNFGSVGASIEGTTIAFRTIQGGSSNSLWTCDIYGRNLQKVLDTTAGTPGFPGGHFTAFDSGDNNNNAQALRLKDGVLVFYARSADAAGNSRFGLYAMPVGGGAVTLLVDNTAAVPGGTGAFNYLDTGYGVDGGRVAFGGSGPGNGGIFTVKVDGSGLVAVADGQHPAHPGSSSPIAGFFGAAIGSGKVTFLGGNGFDFSTGTNALEATDATGGFSYTELFFSGYESSGQTLPGDTNPNYHTRLQNAQIDGNTVVISADDSHGSNFGFYSVPLGGGAPQKIIDQSDALPGGGVLSGNRSHVATGGVLVFDADGGTPALYSFANGVLKRLFGAGDNIGGYVPDYQTGVSPGGYSNGRILLTTGGRFDLSLSVASPAALGHPPFFAGEAALGNGVYYLAFSNGNPFGYYSYFTDPRYIFHFDLGYEYVFDANDGNSGVYLYDFKSNGFFYTSPAFPFPYLYDFTLNTALYYYPAPNNAGHYNTNGIRYFYNLDFIGDKRKFCRKLFSKKKLHQKNADFYYSFNERALRLSPIKSLQYRPDHQQMILPSHASYLAP